jgi:RNA polymerase sigma-70 factor (ECF subfamily)
MPTSQRLHGRKRDVARATDHELIAETSNGDADAFEELYRRHSDHTFMLARKLCTNRELAEEVTQESFIALWRSAHRYRPALGSVSVWLSSIVRNRAIDAWRRAAVRPIETPVVEDGPGQLHTAIGGDTPAPERAVVLSLIAELPGPQKEAVFLAYFAGMTHDEIAVWSEAPLGTVKGRIRMGLQKIRDGLEEQSAPACEPARGSVPVADLDAGRRRRSAREWHRRPAVHGAPRASATG